MGIVRIKNRRNACTDICMLKNIMVISVPAIHNKISHILANNIPFAIYIMKVTETVVYKQGHLVLGFRQTESSYFNF